MDRFTSQLRASDHRERGVAKSLEWGPAAAGWEGLGQKLAVLGGRFSHSLSSPGRPACSEPSWVAASGERGFQAWNWNSLKVGHSALGYKTWLEGGG